MATLRNLGAVAGVFGSLHHLRRTANYCELRGRFDKDYHGLIKVSHRRVGATAGDRTVSGPLRPGTDQEDTLLRRSASAVLSLALAGPLALAAAEPAAADTTQTSSCTDGGGHLWQVQTVWEGLDTESDGVTRVIDNAVSFTSSAPDATTVDYTLSTYDGDGALVKSIAASDRSFDFDRGGTYLRLDPRNPPSAPGKARIVLSVGDGNDGEANCTVTFVQPGPGATAVPTAAIQNSPAQAASIVWGSAANARPYAHPGGLVVAGRDNYGDQEFKDVSAAGGTVLIYLDPVIDNDYGRYHDLLDNASECGPAVSRWPGSYKANEWGYLNDFRTGSALQSKLQCVLEKMVAENPHMGGWFLDDVGSRSWFPGIDWDSFPDKAAYRAGAIALTQTMRKVADEHGLIFIVNGTWSANDGGGYPDAGQSGNSLADGGFVEHHDGEISYFKPYGCSSQWAQDSTVTHGKAINYAVTNTAAGLKEYASSGCYAYVNNQPDYDGAPMWGSSHPTGLPSRVAR